MSLTVRLLLSFLLVVATSVGVVAYLAGRATEQEFKTYVDVGGGMFAARTANSLASYHRETGGWSGVDLTLRVLRRSAGDRLILADLSGRIIADSSGLLQAGEATDGLALGDAVPVEFDGWAVGLLFTPSLAAGGLGQGRGVASATSPVGRETHDQVTSQTPEEVFQTAVSRSVLASAGVAGVLALALGALASWQVVRPLRWLTSGAVRLSYGDLGHRVKVVGNDEVSQLARAFNSMAEALDRDEQARRDLLADVAHELRTPLTVIQGTADAILDGVFEPTADRILVIKEESGLLAKTIADLRDLALAESGRLALERAPANARDLAERAARGAEAIGRTKGVAVDLVAPLDLPVLSVDSDRLLQVLGNLLGNAVRHTPSGGHVTLEVAPHPEGILFSVRDTGEGIPKEDLPHLFERFYRVDRSRSRQTGGSGLGLAIARRLVEAHGGRIWAESEPRQGSRFAFVLPG